MFLDFWFWNTSSHCQIKCTVVSSMTVFTPAQDLPGPNLEFCSKCFTPSYNERQLFKTELKQLNSPMQNGLFQVTLPKEQSFTIRLPWSTSALFQNQEELTPRFSSLNSVGGITRRPSLGKNIWIILSRSSQVALRNTPFGSLTTMKRSWKWGQNQTLSKAFSLHSQTHAKKPLICSNPSTPKVTPITPVPDCCHVPDS